MEANEGSNTQNQSSKTRKKIDTPTLYEHSCRCHLPHDPRLCDACMRARIMSKKNTSNPLDVEIQDSDKGFVYNLDFVGPYEPDVDGNIFGLVGVEVGHTNYGIVTLTKHKDASTTRDEFIKHRGILKNLSHEGHDVVRVHHDCDGSFEKRIWRVC